MKHRHNRFRRPDPFVILAIIVGIGVILTTTAQAGPGAEPPPLPDTAAPLGLAAGQTLSGDWMAYRPGQPLLMRRMREGQLNLVSGRGRGPSVGVEVDRSREAELHRYGLAGARPGAVVRLSVSKRF